MSEQRPIAVFDIDGSISRTNFVVEMMDAAVECGVFPEEARGHYGEAHRRWLRTRDRETFLAYTGGVVSSYLLHIRGVRAETFEPVVERALRRVRDLLYVYTSRLLDELRETHFLVAISAAPDTLVGRFASEFGFSAFHASRYAIDGGVFTGEAVPGHLDKGATLRRIATEHGLEFAGSIGLGDTDGDIPFLELVERPVALNPNKELLSHALARGWEVVYEVKDTFVSLPPGRVEVRGGFGHYLPAPGAKRLFKVKTPSGVLADGEWSEPSEIPAKLPDRFENYFDTSEAEIVEVTAEGIKPYERGKDA